MAKENIKRLTITVGEYGTITLRNCDGAWVGPCLGDFSSTGEARQWAHGNGYTVARNINRMGAK